MPFSITALDIVLSFFKDIVVDWWKVGFSL